MVMYADIIDDFELQNEHIICNDDNIQKFTLLNMNGAASGRTISKKGVGN